MSIITYVALVPASISTLYLIGMAYRFHQLRSNIEAEIIKLNCSLRFKITLLTCNIVFQSLQFSTVFWCKSCFEYSRYIMAALLVNIAALILQIFLMIYEYRKRVPIYCAHKLYWIANWFACVGILGIVIFHHKFSIEFALLAIQVLDLTLLLVYTLFIRKQDLVEFEELGFFSSEIPEIDMSSQEQRFRISTFKDSQTQLIKIEVSKTWNIIDKDIELKLYILFINNEKNYKIKKTFTQFLAMHAQTLLDCQYYLDLHNNELLQLNYLIKQIEDSHDLQLIANIQRYLNILISKPDLASTALMDFLELPAQEREFLETLKQNKQDKVQNTKKPAQQHTHRKWDVQSAYLPYLIINIQEHQTIRQSNDSFVQFKIVTHYNSETITVQKRFREFFELHEQFKQTKYVPPFPQRALSKLTEQDVEERQKDLEIYLKVIANDKQNHQNQFLLKFLGLTSDQYLKQQQQKVLKDCEIAQNVTIRFVHYDQVFDASGDKFYRYTFQVVNQNGTSNIMYKRYSQFDELHSVLKHKFSQLPILPQKSQTSPNSRSIQLTQYLNDLVQVPSIFENPHFRQFFEIPFECDVDSSVNDSFTGFNQIISKLDKDSFTTQLENMRERLWE